MNRRSYVTALAVLGLGAALVLLAYGRPWVAAVVDDPGLPPITVELTGAEWFPAGAAAGVVALAGLAAVVATRRLGRAVTGVLLLAAGVLAGWPAVLVARGGTGGLDAVVAQRVGTAVPSAVTTTPWWWVALAGALLVGAAGLACLRWGGRWPSLGRRYERAPAPTSAAPAAGLAAADAWAALDRGEDPTD